MSNLALRDWLETLRVELAAQAGIEVPRPGPRAALKETLSDEMARLEALVGRLTDPAKVPVDPAERSPEQQGQWILAHLIGWHRREDKATWWEYHRLMDLTPEQLVDERSPIGLLVPAGPMGEPDKGQQVWRYGFPDQEFDLGVGDKVHEPRQKAAGVDDNPYHWDCGEIVAIDPAGLTVDLKRAASAPQPEAIVGLPLIPTSSIASACARSPSGWTRTGSTAWGRIGRLATSSCVARRGSARRPEPRCIATTRPISRLPGGSRRRSITPSCRSRVRLVPARRSVAHG